MSMEQAFRFRRRADQDAVVQGEIASIRAEGREAARLCLLEIALRYGYNFTLAEWDDSFHIHAVGVGLDDVPEDSWWARATRNGVPFETGNGFGGC
jgi:hypothetical protein